MDLNILQVGLNIFPICFILLREDLRRAGNGVEERVDNERDEKRDVRSSKWADDDRDLSTNTEFRVFSLLISLFHNNLDVQESKRLVYVRCCILPNLPLLVKENKKCTKVNL